MTFSKVTESPAFRRVRARRVAAKIGTYILSLAPAAVLGIWYHGRLGIPGVIAVALVNAYIAWRALKMSDFLVPGWEGTVTEKKRRRYQKNNIVARQLGMREEFIVIAETPEGDKKEFSFTEELQRVDGSFEIVEFPASYDESPYRHADIYTIGSRVKKHRFCPYPEKLLTEDDVEVLCILCGTITPREKKKCRRCGVPFGE